MLKALLVVSLSVLSLYCEAQDIADASVTSDFIAEDSSYTIRELSCTTSDNSSAILTWKTDARVPEFFAIERSDNGRSFEVVTVLNNLGTRPSYQWIDEVPRKGKSFYRIRYSFAQGPPLYSRMVSVQIAGYIAIKFYPNPVDHILIVRAETPVDVQITDANGRARITEARVQGLHTINVSSLEKGIYLIRFSNKLTNVISQEKLIKN